MTDDAPREHLCTQKIFPTVNNNDLLEIRIPPYPKGHLDLGNVMLHFKSDNIGTAGSGFQLGYQRYVSLQTPSYASTKVMKSLQDQKFLCMTKIACQHALFTFGGNKKHCKIIRRENKIQREMV